MVNNPNDTNVTKRNAPAFPSVDDNNTLESGRTIGRTNHDDNTSSTTVSQNHQLELAMKIADTIRRYENESMDRARNSKGTAESNDINNTYDYHGNYVHPMITNVRTFWETPGIQSGCITACCCIIPVIPIRRSVLHYMNHSLNLGTSFPDLLFTPAVTMLVAQCSVYVGTCYGVLHYLNKVTTPITQAEAATTNADVKSRAINDSVIDSVCHDPVFTDSTSILKFSSLENYKSSSSSSSFLQKYDVRNKVTIALHDAVQSCQKRRDRSKNLQP